MIRALLLTSRPLSWVNTAFPFAAAYLVSAGRIDAPLVVGTIFFLIPYNLAMYGINDVFDYESDARNPRKGGVEGALLQPRWHRATLIASGVLAVPFVVYLVAIGNPVSWIVLAISLFALVAYSVPGLRFKERPFLDSITSSTHFVSPAVYALALVGVAPTLSLVLLLSAYFLWGAASHAFGAVQDIGADRAAGIGSIATVIGARTTVVLSALLYNVAAILLIFSSAAGQSPMIAVAAVLAFPYSFNVLRFSTLDDENAAIANRGWRRFLWLNFVTGFLVTLLLIWAVAF